jgi:hypothetical protein
MSWEWLSYSQKHVVQSLFNTYIFGIWSREVDILPSSFTNFFENNAIHNNPHSPPHHFEHQRPSWTLTISPVHAFLIVNLNSLSPKHELWSHVVILWFFITYSRYIPSIHLKWLAIFLKSWTSTSYSSNSISSSVTSGQSSLFIAHTKKMVSDVGISDLIIRDPGPHNAITIEGYRDQVLHADLLEAFRRFDPNAYRARSRSAWLLHTKHQQDAKCRLLPFCNQRVFHYHLHENVPSAYIPSM